MSLSWVLLAILRAKVLSFCFVRPLYPCLLQYRSSSMPLRTSLTGNKSRPLLSPAFSWQCLAMMAPRFWQKADRRRILKDAITRQYSGGKEPYFDFAPCLQNDF